MQSAGVNQAWKADWGANNWLGPGGTCNFIGRRLVNGRWVLQDDLYANCDTPMGYVCDMESEPVGMSPTTVIGLISGGSVLGCCLLMCCCYCFCDEDGKCNKEKRDSWSRRRREGRNVTVERP